MDRRSLLQGVVRAAALPAGAQFLAQWMRAAQSHQHGAATEPDESSLANYQPKFFQGQDFEALRAFTELLIPTDETPGAKEAHCAEFIDFFLHSMDAYSPETQNQWRAAMTALRTAGFHAANAAGRAKLMAEMADPEIDPSAQHPAFSAYRLIKRENTFAFYTAKAGIIDSLDYRGNTYNIAFPACTHPEHHEV